MSRRWPCRKRACEPVGKAEADRGTPRPDAVERGSMTAIVHFSVNADSILTPCCDPPSHDAPFIIAARVPLRRLGGGVSRVH